MCMCMAQSYSVQTVPDVTRNGYCFSDGVGRISEGLCEAVAARLIRLGRCPAGCVPSALQIRFAGCKGMVSLHPDLCGMKCVYDLHFVLPMWSFSGSVWQVSSIDSCEEGTSIKGVAKWQGNCTRLISAACCARCLHVLGVVPLKLTLRRFVNYCRRAVSAVLCWELDTVDGINLMPLVQVGGAPEHEQV